MLYITAAGALILKNTTTHTEKGLSSKKKRECSYTNNYDIYGYGDDEVIKVVAFHPKTTRIRMLFFVVSDNNIV